MEPATPPIAEPELPDSITPAAHALGAPRIEIAVPAEASTSPATWPRNLATTLVIVTTSLYLLEQLQLVLRPLLIAILLCYLIVPSYLRLRQRMRPVFSFLLIILVILVGFQALSRMIFSDMTRINRNLPHYQRRAAELSDRARKLFEPFLPPALLPEKSVATPDASVSTKSTMPEDKLPTPVAANESRPKFASPADAKTVKSADTPAPTSEKTQKTSEKQTELAEASASERKTDSSSEDSNLPPSHEIFPDVGLAEDTKLTLETPPSPIGDVPELKREPSTAMIPPSRPMPTESPTWELTRRVISQVASALANFLLESLVVVFYMIFLLQESSRFGDRIRSSFSHENAVQIEKVAASINRAISDYLSVKVKSSLLVAIPTALAVWSFGITGAATWGVLAFFGNFLPYVGGLVATLLPIVLAFLEFDTLVHPILFAIVLLGISGITSNLIEPAMTGKALDLSPLVVMIGLAFWSLLWGFVGMCLAIPLTVVLKIILEHTPATRPIGRLLGESQRPG